MNEKPWYASKGVWGSLFAAAASGFVAINEFLPEGGKIPDDVAGQVSDPNTALAFAAVGAFVASIVAWFGRVKATQPIRKSLL